MTGRPLFIHGIPIDEWQLACIIANEGSISQRVQEQTGIYLDRLPLDAINVWIQYHARRQSRRLRRGPRRFDK